MLVRLLSSKSKVGLCEYNSGLQVGVCCMPVARKYRELHFFRTASRAAKLMFAAAQPNVGIAAPFHGGIYVPNMLIETLLF